MFKYLLRFFYRLLYENPHNKQPENFHYKKERTNKFTKKRQLMLSSQRVMVYYI